MNKINILLAFVVLFALGCTEEFGNSVDFTDVLNPNLSETSVVGQPNSAGIWLEGIEREISRTFNEIIVLAELGSDNYVNTQTFFNQFMDNLDIRTTDPDIRDLQNEIARVAKMAEFGLETVGPGDPNYSSDTEAEYHFMLGMSRMLAGMYFSALPQETQGVPISASDNYTSAISSFDSAIAQNNLPEYQLAKARAAYYLGDKAQAVAAATAALGLSPDFAREARYDQKNTPVNTMESALYARATFDDLQPLPSLDFLDPKYSFLSAELDPSLYYLKAEEAYLILAEASHSDGDAASAAQYLTDLLAVVGSREVRSVDETIEQRSEADPGGRPNNSSVVVNGRSGLVIDRTSDVQVASISGTSLTASEISNMAADDAGLALIHRTRQEVFIAEGLRFVDMGVKMVINENEILQNENVSEGDPSTIAYIPPFIDGVKDNLDDFTYDAGAGTVTTMIDVTAILVANKTSADVLPFH